MLLLPTVAATWSANTTLAPARRRPETFEKMLQDADTRRQTKLEEAAHRQGN